jgi:hypothetical protein
MNKQFDCVKMKNELQVNLYKEINPKNFDEYYSKLNERIRKSSLYKEMKHRIKNRSRKHNRVT